MDFDVLHNKLVRFDKRSGEEIKDLLTLTYYEPEQYKYSVFKVSHEYVARPDLICLDHYGNNRYVDIICKLNGISNPFELNEGMTIALPSPGDIGRFIYKSDKLEALDNATVSSAPSIDQPKVKTRGEKRKANEAVVGDSRYHIDSERQIVIY